MTSEYLRRTNRDSLGINGFLSLSTQKVLKALRVVFLNTENICIYISYVPSLLCKKYQNYAVETPSLATVLAPIAREGMKSTRKIRGYIMNNICRICPNIV